MRATASRSATATSSTPTSCGAPPRTGIKAGCRRTYIEAGTAHDAVARRAYDSTHLTVGAGETLDVLEQVGDYLLCRTAAGVQGWVRTACVEEIVEER